MLRDQIDYYRARAGEYDQWWFRQGRFDRGAELNAAWLADTVVVESDVDAWLSRRKPAHVLELACGTGLFTRRLAHAAKVTAVDASAEVLAINRARVASERVDYIEADLFRWQPTHRYDAVFFSFWLSHVPAERFAAFWTVVRDALAPRGAVYLIDSANDRTSMARDHPLPREGDPIVTRRLNDGREFRIVKLFYDADELNALVARQDFDARIQRTERYFLHGEVLPRA